MALAAWSLASVAELKEYMGASGVNADAALESALNRSTEWLEGETRRRFVNRGNITEYHSLLDGGLTTIQLQEWPTVTVTSVHESTNNPRVYDGTTLLTANTHYQVIKSYGQIRRLSGSEPTTWACGHRTIQVIYDFGYKKTDGTPAGAAAVPEDLKLLCLFVAAGIFQESERKRWGVSSVTDGLGTVTRFLGYLPPDMKARLMSYCRRDFGSTWEAA